MPWATERRETGSSGDGRTVPKKLPFSTHLLSREEVMTRPSPIPATPGVYGWCFRKVPPGVPTKGCRIIDGLPLLYVGISPSAPPTNGTAASNQNLRKRIRYHFRGNAAGSTLRRTLGCLLADKLGIALRRVGSGERLTFTKEGEAKLSAWMGKNALVTYLARANPWKLEDELIARLVLPLNLRGNSRCSFHSTLSAIRSRAKASARARPIVL